MRIISGVRYLFVALFLLAISAASFAQIGIVISVGFAPPPIPVYVQPICPGEGYICEKFRVQITVDRKKLQLGLYKDERDAAAIYNEAAKMFFGDFAQVNQI